MACALYNLFIDQCATFHTLLVTRTLHNTSMQVSRLAKPMEARLRLPHASMRPLRVVAARSTSATKSPTAAVDMKERMAFLQEDLTHLFDDQGVDESQYDDVVTFLDPITRYNNVQGYMFNIRMLKKVFSPIFELHSIKQTGPLEITTRWTMTMTFTPARVLQLSKWWDPVITFTGTSCYGLNPSSGRINRHVDTWDSINNQQFFSLEAFGDFFSQLLQPFTTPALETPQYTLLKRTAKFQVRQYKPFLVASAPLDNVTTGSSSSSGSSGASSSSGAGSAGSSDGTAAPVSTDSPASSSSSSSSKVLGINPASAGMKAFNALAGYIFGSNVSGTKMKMTTPVLSDTDGRMQFVITASPEQVPLSSLPAPVNPSVQLQQQPGGVYAAVMFNGVATPRKCREQQQLLLAALEEAGLTPLDEGRWVLARYNDPSVKPRFRRNEVLLELKDFDLWGS